MPYIADFKRQRFEKAFAAMPPAADAGELNYVLTRVALRYLKAKGGGHSYQHLNDVLGAFEGAKAEFNRRIVVPYENLKIRDNGDIEP